MQVAANPARAICEVWAKPSKFALANQRKPAWIPLISQDFEPKTGVHFSAILLGARLAKKRDPVNAFHLNGRPNVPVFKVARATACER